MSEVEDGDGLTEKDVSSIGLCCLLRTSIEPNLFTLDNVDDERPIELALSVWMTLDLVVELLVN